MKTHETCPKCRSQKLIVVEEVRYPHPEASQTMSLPFAVTSVELPNPDKGFLAAAKVRIEAGTFEAWICAKCGFTEWYAKNLAELVALSERTGEVRVLSRDSGPYRD